MTSAREPFGPSQALNKHWECSTVEQALSVLETSTAGLSLEEARQRLERFGRNELPRSPPPNFPRIFVRQFASPLIYVLAAAAGVSLLLNELTDATFIAAVLLINALIGSVQEWRAARGVLALQGLLRMDAIVERGGALREVAGEEVVPGDIVWMESGAKVPADLRLIATNSATFDEALLTGESLPVSKDHTVREPAAKSVGDRPNMAYAGTLLSRGRAQGVVIATGSYTEVGRIARDVAAHEPAPPPLMVRLGRFMRRVGIAVLGTVVLLATLGLLRGDPLQAVFLAAVALAVSAIPEGLPVALTIALSVATRRMVRRNVITRTLAAVEGLGSCTLIVSDKTGTLTCNELTVGRVVTRDGVAYEVSGTGYRPDGVLKTEGTQYTAGLRTELDEFVRAVALNNEASLYEREDEWHHHGDPTDVALLTLAAKYMMHRETLIDVWPQVNAIPFESERRYSATYHTSDGETRVFAKGAPEQVLTMVADPDARRWLKLAEEMAASGFRVLAVADGITQESRESVPAPPSGLRFLGLVGMIDPLRPGASDAVKRAATAGVRTFMCTGDHPVTALAISRELGIARHIDEVVTGDEVEVSDESQLRHLIGSRTVFARMAPHHKLRVVQAAQAAGHFVAVTGDGVNDAPALRVGNVGVAMGKGGTDVAREAADLVVTDDNYASIVGGIEEGRVAYDNIRKVVYLLISTGASEIVLITLAIATGLPIPLTPVQLLWLNLVTNGFQDVALGMEPNEGGTLERPPRSPGEGLLNALMVRRTLITATLTGGIGFALFAWLLSDGWSTFSARNAVLLYMVLFENVHIGNCRSEYKSIFELSPVSHPMLLGATLLAQSIHLGALYVGVGQRVLDVEPVSLSLWFSLLGLVLIHTVVIELDKLWLNHRNR